MRRLTAAAVLISLALVGPALAAKPPKPPKPPKPGATSAVTIAVSPSTVVFGSSTSITGRATGAKAAGARVDLQRQTGTSTFANVTSTTADTAGHYTFKVTPTQNTVYRVVAHTAPAATSPSAGVRVQVKVSMGVGTTTPKAGSRVRFSGFVTPAYNGRFVLIQRHTATGWKMVARALLQPAAPVGGVARSKYSKRLRIHSTGTYRAFFNPKDGLRQPNHSAARRLTVH